MPLDAVNNLLLIRQQLGIGLLSICGLVFPQQSQGLGVTGEKRKDGQVSGGPFQRVDPAD